VDARQRALLICRHAPLVRRLVGRYVDLGLSPSALDDLAQEGMVELIHAADEYDPETSPGVTFGRFARRRVRSAIRRELYRTLKVRRRERQSETLPDRPASSAERRVLDEFWRVMDTLSPLERGALVANAGLDGRERRSYGAVSAELGVTLWGVQSLLKSARRKLVERIIW
jgi:RNA polymerase sigma factor (sigma-70 family)